MKDPQYVQFLYFQPCIVHSCAHRRIEVHHWQNKQNHGAGIKPGDEWCVPLCLKHHRELHNDGRETFWKLHFSGKDMEKTINKIIEKLRKKYQDVKRL
jgi:hypothetical protein